jgi:flagellar motor switch protein FliN/FliY
MKSSSLSAGATPDEPSADLRPNGKAVASAAPPLLSLNSIIFKDVVVGIRARLGQTTLSVQDLLALKPGSVVTLESKLNDLVELRLNDSVVARGEIVAVGDNFGVRIVDVASGS